MSLKDSLPWLRNTRIEPKFDSAKKTYARISYSSGELSIAVAPRKRVKSSWTPQVQLLRFVTLVRKGLDDPSKVPVYYDKDTKRRGRGSRSSSTPWHWAAQRVKSSLKVLMPDENTKAIVEDLVSRWSLDPAQRAAMVRAAENKMLMENIGDPDPKAQRLALDTIKSISKDVSVGKEGSSPAQLGQAFGEGLKSVLQGIEVPKEIAAGPDSDTVIDVEFVEEKKPDARKKSSRPKAKV